jgi:hypothetical protein
MIRERSCADAVSCPSCGKHLIIACPDGCANAELGAQASLDPIGSLPGPLGRHSSSSECRAAQPGGVTTLGMIERPERFERHGTRNAILEVLTTIAQLLSPREIAVALGDPSARYTSLISMHLQGLVRDGAVEKITPEGKRYGKYRAPSVKATP